MLKLATVVVLASIVITAYSLQCYQCTANKCDDVSKAPTAKCDSTANVQYRCYKKVEKDKPTGNMNVTRGCYILRNDNDKSYCNIADPSKTESVFCEACDADLCNSATGPNVNVAALAATAVAALAAKMVIH